MQERTWRLSEIAPLGTQSCKARRTMHHFGVGILEIHPEARRNNCRLMSFLPAIAATMKQRIPNWRGYGEPTNTGRLYAYNQMSNNVQYRLQNEGVHHDCPPSKLVLSSGRPKVCPSDFVQNPADITPGSRKTSAPVPHHIAGNLGTLNLRIIRSKT